MDNHKRAIILDLDETLEHGIPRGMLIPGENGLLMVLRPGLDELIDKLKQAKEQGIDIVLCTTAKQLWIDRFFDLKPEFRTLFDKMLTRDNKAEWEHFDKEKNPLEYEAHRKDSFLRNAKPVTTFGYDFVLFIDDNPHEGRNLSNLFEITRRKVRKRCNIFFRI